MDLTRLLRLMPEEERKQIQKVIDILQIGGRSKKTIDNYVCAINRFLKYFESKDISKLNENDIVEYMKYNYLNKSCSVNTYNMNISAIKYFYSINFNKEFNNKLLPHSKLTKKFLLQLIRKHLIKFFTVKKV